jgi:hypothetical protein
MKKILVLSTILLSNMKADLEIQDAIENIKDLRKVFSVRSIYDAFNFFKLTRLIKKHEELRGEFIEEMIEEYFEKHRRVSQEKDWALLVKDIDLYMYKYPDSIEARMHKELNNSTFKIKDQMCKAAAMGQFLFVE